MNAFEVKRVVHEALNERGAKQLQRRELEHFLAHESSASKPMMEFSKKLILGALFFYGTMAMVSLLSWFILGDWPHQIVEYFMWPIFVVLGYLAKSAYENKAKIQRDDKL